MPIGAGLRNIPFATRFVKDEDGNITIVSLAFMAAIGILSAIAWDLNSHEYHRVKLQQLSDRAVLAAADLDQTLPASELVQDYFVKSGYGDVVSNVSVEEGLNFRTVSVTVDGLVDTTFLGGDYYGAAMLGGNAVAESQEATNNRLNNPGPNDIGKSYDDIYKEELTKRTKGDDTTLEDAEEIARENADRRIQARDDAIRDRDAMNEERIEKGLPPLIAAVEDEYLNDEQIYDNEWYKATEKNGPYIYMKAFSEAEERVNNVEISMVLDISGSMGSNNKFREMRDAASIFVDSVINDSTRDLVSISIVPYSEHVSAGPEIMSKFSVNHVHNYSQCLEFDEGDFDLTSMGQWANGSNKTYQQVQHFYWGNSSWNYRDNPVCPQGEHEDIVAFSQDAAELKYKISRLVLRGSTSIFAGMKWAAGLLDPNFQSINASLASDGDTDPAFVNRPVAFDDNETLKTVVLMTDGQNHYSKRINPQVYANSSHYNHWNRNNFDWWVNRNVWYGNRHAWSSEKYWPAYGDSLLTNVCDAAKQNNIVIWSIGFEVTDHGANVMRDCASSPSHFFRVEGVEIREAFSAIARQINQLRLTQ